VAEYKRGSEEYPADARAYRTGQITERFTKAIEQLGEEDEDGEPRLEIRLGGIYALERIARDSVQDYGQIMEILTAYTSAKMLLGLLRKLLYYLRLRMTLMSGACGGERTRLSASCPKLLSTSKRSWMFSDGERKPAYLQNLGVTCSFREQTFGEPTSRELTSQDLPLLVQTFKELG
jgi:hypothetical protein